MNIEEALEVADEAVFVNLGRRLSKVEIAILKGSWENLTYEQIASEASYSVAYVKRHVGPELWNLLTQALGEKVSKSNFHSALERHWRKFSRVEGARKIPENSIQNSKSNPSLSALNAEKQITNGKGQIVITFDGNVESFLENPQVQAALLVLMQKASADGSVKIEKIEKGSIKTEGATSAPKYIEPI